MKNIIIYRKNVAIKNLVKFKNAYKKGGIKELFSALLIHYQNILKYGFR